MEKRGCCATKCSVCSLSHGQTVLGVVGWRRQEGMSLHCPLLLCLPADLQGNGMAQLLQLFFSHIFSPSASQRSGKVHPLGFPWVDWQDCSIVKPQISSKGSGKRQELGYCVTAGSAKCLSWDMLVCLFGGFDLIFLNSDKVFALTAVFGHQPAHASKQKQTPHFYFLQKEIRAFYSHLM